MFENVIDFKLKGTIDGLLKCESTPREAYENILKLSGDEIFLDLGAYNGDTVREFLENTNGQYQKIYAVEPDRKNYKKLVLNTKDLHDCVCINSAISNCTQKVFFDAKNGRNSTVSTSGKEIDAICVDDILCGQPVSYIKMDVEGQEGAAIDGAIQTIKNNKPKMLISCYHRAQDLFDIPERVLSIRDDYKVYMRHYPYIPAWDTSFYFV